LSYAKKILNRFQNAEIVGVEIDVKSGYVPGPDFLGFDIIDEHFDVSLLTNCGGDEDGIMNQYILENALLRDLNRALKIRDYLRQKSPEDSHAGNCKVWAVY